MQTEHAPIQTEPRNRLLVLFRPSVAAFEAIGRDPKAGSVRACIWIFIAGFLGASISRGINPELAVSAQPWMYAMIGVVFFLLHTGLLHLMARIVGGKGAYARFASAWATFTAPLLFLTDVLSVIPWIVYMGVPLFVYWVALGIIAVKALYGLSWGKAVAVTILPFIGVVVLVWDVWLAYVTS